VAQYADGEFVVAEKFGIGTAKRALAEVKVAVRDIAVRTGRCSSSVRPSGK